ncbi:phage tail terminator-like protein [Zhengella sp. ZM62]|uniref:phage tail terminator-like protein n=1 Tax=Zhengella sedimenti TaxID=3390035 RepID=UPI003974E0C8
MATGIDASIIDGLCTKLDEAVIPSMPIAWPNVSFSPDPAAGYLGVSYFPAAALQQELGDNGRNRFIGVFQVSVFYPKDRGEVAAREIAADVANHFKRGTVISHDGLSIRILRPPLAGSGFVDGPFFQVPVSINYQVDADNP